MTASTRRRLATYSASRNESACSALKQPSPAASSRGRSGGGSTVHTVTMRPTVIEMLQRPVTDSALRPRGREANFRRSLVKKMPEHNRLLLSLGCALTLALGCDVLPKFQLQLQKDIQSEFHVAQAMVVVMDTTYMVVAVFDDARAALEPKEHAAFAEQLARFAVTHYQKTRLRTVGVMISRATHRTDNDPEPTLFVPEYHPDGTVRLALMPNSRGATTPVMRKQ